MAVERRPGMVTFAGVLMFIIGGVHAFLAISEFTGSSWLSEPSLGIFGGNASVWGIIDIVIALLAFYTGYDIIKGGMAGRFLGYILAALSAVRWFIFMPVAPIAALIIMTICILAIFGLSTNDEWFY